MIRQEMLDEIARARQQYTKARSQWRRRGGATADEEREKKARSVLLLSINRLRKYDEAHPEEMLSVR